MTTRRLILDLSRMLSRAKSPVPSGIDRVELAYAEGLLHRAEPRLHFAAMHPLGSYAHLPRTATRKFLDLTARRWRAAENNGEAVQRAARWLLNGVLLRGNIPQPPFSEPRQWGSGGSGGGREGRGVYLLVSHHHLDRPNVIEATLARERAAFVCMVHDLIPMEYPEYARPTEPARHYRRIQTVARMADAIIVNSEATRQSLLPWLREARRDPPVIVLPLGIDPQTAHEIATGPAPEADQRPTFVYIGTIEPRKNHLLLLQIWRRLAEQLGHAAPRLVLIGRRGWENEQILDMLDRAPALRGLVEEHSAMPDAEAHALMRCARAVLLPSFAEGYGLPLAEGLARGTPALCSDLPALREVGRHVPEYLDPLDGLGWMRAIMDYAAPVSPRRDAQLERLKSWHAPSWTDHIADVLDLLDREIA
jgi:glycosyltransferase involved in cell wall biosynthesis